jgi:hypothetical protein
VHNTEADFPKEKSGTFAGAKAHPFKKCRYHGNMIATWLQEGRREMGTSAPDAQFRSRFFLFRFCVDNLGVGIVAGQAAFFGGELEGFFTVELGLADQFFDAVG